jgi:hypothetical protein
VAVEPPPKKPWLLISGGSLLAVLFAYSLFAGWLPARHQAQRLRHELEDLYRREAQLETRLVQVTRRAAAREQQLQALRAERDGLARRVAELERALGAGRSARR